MSGWRKVAEQLQQGHEPQHDRHNRHNSTPPESGPALADPLASVRAWQAALDALDRENPLHGLDAQRWRQLLGDAEWLLDCFGRQAACDGWSAADLFGVLPSHDAWGGVADRLQGSRSLVMTTDLACWRRMFTETADCFARGASVMAPLVVMWEAPRSVRIWPPS